MNAPKPAHRPAGTPDGGQFAATSRAEAAGVELDGQHAAATPSTWDQLNAAYAARDQADGEIERLSAREMADSIRARFPTATTLHLEDSDQGSHFAALRITDASGQTLHRIGDADDDESADADSDLDILASNFDNDSVSPLLTNHGTRRSPDYRLDLTVHGTPAKGIAGIWHAAGWLSRAEAVAEIDREDAQSQTISRSDAVAEFKRAQETGGAAPWTATSISTSELPHVPLAELYPNTPVWVDHPEIQAGAVRDKVLSAGTTFHRSRDGVYPSEPYQMRFQTNRPIDDDEMRQMAGAIGYAYASKVRGEPLGEPLRDSPYSFMVSADTTKSRRDDVGQALEEFEQELPGMVRDGSPVRTTDRNGPAGTRLVLGLQDPDLTFETYYDSVTGADS